MTTDITELAQSLKAAAEKASGGDWVKESGDGWDATCSNDDQANSGFIIAHFVGPDSAANREFVQLANPANVSALVEVLEKARQRIAELEDAEQKLCAANVTLDARAELAERQLESRAVKLPKPISVLHRREFTEAHCAIYAYPEAEVNAALDEAGIKWEAER